MATMEQARDVEIDRALIEIRQRQQQMQQDWEKHPVEIDSMVRQTQAQLRIAFWTAVLGGAAAGGLIVHFLKL
jgi:hypothetical protein